MTEEDTCENEDKGCKTTCCCGDDINHSCWAGHMPVSMHWWYCERNFDKLNAPDAPKGEDNPVE